MKKRFIIIIFAVVFVLGFILIYNLNKSSLSVPQCEILGNENSKISCYLEYAKNTGDASTCQKLDSASRDACYVMFVDSTNDSALCKKIGDPRYKQGCYIHLATATKDYSFCKEINSKEYRDDCYNMIAQANSDLSPCYEIEGNLRAICLSNTFFKIGNKTASCDVLETETDRKDCERWKLGLMTHFQANNQIEFECNPLNGIEKDNCILRLVKETFEPNSTFCDPIINSEIKEGCLKLVI